MVANEVPSLKLPRNPFRLRIAPQDAVAHKGWRKAGERALARLLAGPGLVVVLGEPGTGKTLLLRDLQRRLLAMGREARLVTRGDAPLDPGFAPAGQRFLLIDEARAAGSIFDAASLAPDLRCIVADLPEFEVQFSALPQKPTIVRLAALSPKEARAFVAARIAQAARSPDLLTPDALNRLVQASGGVPRALCVLGATALHFARVEMSPQVTGEHIARALATSVLPPQSPGPDAADPAIVARTLSQRVGQAFVPGGSSARRRRWAAALAILVLAGATWSVALRNRPGADSTPLSAAAPAAEQVDPVQPGAALVVPQTPAHDGESPIQASGPAQGDAQPTSASGGGGPAPLPPAPRDLTQAALEHGADVAPAAAAFEHPTASPAAGLGPTPGLAQSDPAMETAAAATPPTPTHIVISYPRHDGESNHLGNPNDASGPLPAAALAGRLRLAGYFVGAPVPVARTFVTPGIYAYFAEDLAAAEELHAAFGPAAPEVELITLPPGSSLPRPGTLEIMVPPDAHVEAWSDALTASGAHPPAEPTWAEGAAQPTLPADNANIAVDPAGSAALEWSEPAEHELYFVEVRALDGGAPHEVFAAYVDHGPIQVALDPASRHYAWRIHTVAEAGGHYRLGRWSHFTVQPAGLPPGSSAALPSSEVGP